MDKKSKKSSFYRDLKVPAKVFFDILDTGNNRLLVKNGSPKQLDLDKAFENIFDLYYEKKNDGTLKLILKTRKRIVMLYRKIGTIEGVVTSLTAFNFPKKDVERLLEGLKKLKIYIDADNDLNEELLDVLKITVAGLKTRLAIEEDNLEQLTKGKKADFIDSIVSLEQVFEYHIPDSLSLDKYLSYQAAANKIMIKRSKIK